MDGPGILAVDSELARVMEPLGGVRLDFAYGRSWLNRGRHYIVYVDQDQSDPIARVGKHGWSVRGALGLPPAARKTLDGAGLGFLAEGLAPLIQFGVARDRNHVEWPNWNGRDRSQRDIRDKGWELTVANVFTLRRGHIEDRDGDIIDDTSGWGLGLQVGRFGGFRYDHAVVPHGPGAGPGETRRVYGLRAPAGNRRREVGSGAARSRRTQTCPSASKSSVAVQPRLSLFIPVPGRFVTTSGSRIAPPPTLKSTGVSGARRSA